MPGRHRGGICPSCSHNVLIRDGVLVEHSAEALGTLTKRRRCAGSGQKPVRLPGPDLRLVARDE